MAFYSYFLILFLSVFSSNFGECTEFVPVYLWGSNKMSEHVPALHKISQDSFKDTLLELSKKDPFIIVFAERTLSPEDFAQHNKKGESAFVQIQELKNQGSYVSYRPYVQNPIGALRQINKPISEMSIESILTSTAVPKENIWIIHLNDAKEEESRFHLLRRHDNDIVSIAKDLSKKHPNFLAIYTANHTSWVAPDDVTHMKSRALLQEETPSPITFSGNNILMYLSDTGFYKKGNDKVDITSDFKLDVNLNATTLIATLSKASTNIELNFKKTNQAYWQGVSIKVDNQELGKSIVKDFYAPVGFSYHCDNFTVKSQTEDKSTVTLYLPGFQMQVFSENITKFGDAYDCVGFTSVPIWSGLFVTAIMLLIITFGLTMMMDIKTMDRFDDPKGKTITVNASE